MNRLLTEPRRTGREVTEDWNRVDIPDRVKERAATKVVRSSGGCWISTYSVASHGYAQIGWQNGGERHVVLAHRASWERVNGRVPSGMTIDHLCRERRCVNPAHLRLLDNFENARRTHGMDWQLGECPNGHPNSMLADDLHRKDKQGNKRVGKRCRECVKLYRKRYEWRTGHPGEPYPDGLLLSAEKPSVKTAA